MGENWRTITDIPEQWSNPYDYNNNNCNYETSALNIQLFLSYERVAKMCLEMDDLLQ